MYPAASSTCGSAEAAVPQLQQQSNAAVNYGDSVDAWQQQRRYQDAAAAAERFNNNSWCRQLGSISWDQQWHPIVATYLLPKHHYNQILFRFHILA